MPVRVDDSALPAATEPTRDRGQQAGEKHGDTQTSHPLILRPGAPAGFQKRAVNASPARIANDSGDAIDRARCGLTRRAFVD